MVGALRHQEIEQHGDTTMIWLVRPPPQHDELLSSWIVRIAWHNVVKLEGMTSKLWGPHSQIWSRDIDRLANPLIYKLVADLSLTSHQRAYETTLESYQGLLFERLSKRGSPPWIMPLGSRKRERFQYGLQCCPLCLREDVEPYYRRKWRLAFVCTCLKHSMILIDRCDCCGSPISFHQSDFGRSYNAAELRMTYCVRCGRDYRDIKSAPIVSCPLGRLVLDFQKLAESTLELGGCVLSSNTPICTLLFFEGLHHIVRVVTSNGYCRKFRKEIAKDLGIRFSQIKYEHGQYCERLELPERFEFCAILGWLLSDWPNNFVRCAKVAKLSSSYFQTYRETLPYWIAMPIKWYLDRTWYHPNLEEINAVIHYLDKNGFVISANEISRRLGRWYVTRHDKEYLKPLDTV